MSDYYKLGKAGSFRRPVDDKNTIYFEGWALHRRGKEYCLTYISAGHGGDELMVKINEEDYEAAKSGKMELSELIQKSRESLE